jgi:AcrR family transcriptional regulator
MSPPRTEDGLPISSTRSRTRAALLDAAVRVFARKGVDVALNEIATEAGVSSGSFYNYFRTRDEVIEAAGGVLAKRFFGAIAQSYAAVEDPAERVSIGTRRFMREAMSDPVWGAAVLRVWGSAPATSRTVSEAMVSDLRAGKRAGVFRFGSERAAVDLMQGTTLAAMRSVLEGRAGNRYPEEVARLILRGLGVGDAEAGAIVKRSLPPLLEAPP